MKIESVCDQLTALQRFLVAGTMHSYVVLISDENFFRVYATNQVDDLKNLPGNCVKLCSIAHGKILVSNSESFTASATKEKILHLIKAATNKN